jgi:hypothetical protein
MREITMEEKGGSECTMSLIITSEGLSSTDSSLFPVSSANQAYQFSREGLSATTLYVKFNSDDIMNYLAFV